MVEPWVRPRAAASPRPFAEPPFAPRASGFDGVFLRESDFGNKAIIGRLLDHSGRQPGAHALALPNHALCPRHTRATSEALTSPRVRCDATAIETARFRRR